MIKQFKVTLMLLVVAVLLPTGVWAAEGDTHIVTSTFTNMANVDNEESWSLGTLVTSEGNDWNYSGAGNPNWPSYVADAGGFALSLKKKGIGLTNAFEMTGYVKKIRIRAGGSLSKIEVYTFGGENDLEIYAGSVTPTSSSLTTYTIEPEEGVWVDSGDEGVMHRLNVYVVSDPDKDYFDATFLESIEVEYVEGPAPEETITATFTEWRKEDLPSSEAIYGTLSSEEYHAWHVTVADVNAMVNMTNIDKGDGTYERCVKFNVPSREFVSLNYYPVEGTVNKVIVRAMGDFSSIVCNVSDMTTYAHREITMNVTNGFNAIQEYVFQVGGFTSDDCDVNLTFNGASQMYVSKITIVMGDGDEPEGFSGTTGMLKWKAVETGATIKVVDRATGMEVEKPQYLLTISGEGRMDSYMYYEGDIYTPWKDLTTITEVVVGEGAQNIGSCAFANLEHLKKVSLPSSLRWIGNDAFSRTAISEIDLPEGLETIQSSAFAYVYPLKSIHFPASLVSIGDGAFSDNRLESITVAEGNSTFYSPEGSNAVVRKTNDVLVLGCPVTVIPNTVAGIGDYAFYIMRRLTGIVIPESVTTIGNRAFAFCSNLEGTVALTNVTTIGEGAFISDWVNEFILGADLTSIGNDAFVGCNRATDVYCYADPTKLTWEGYDNAKFFKSEKGTKFHVKAADKGAWETTFPDLNATIVGDLDGEQVETDGDVDGNGETTAADVVAVTSVINGTVTDEKTKAAADVNKDGKVDIADIVALINLIFGK